eukprot:SAG31_NODE_11826_length_994_cov_1.976536_1_plen_168_part_00
MRFHCFCQCLYCHCFLAVFRKEAKRRSRSGYQARYPNSGTMKTQDIDFQEVFGCSFSVGLFAARSCEVKCRSALEFGKLLGCTGLLTLPIRRAVPGEPDQWVATAPAMLNNEMVHVISQRGLVALIVEAGRSMVVAAGFLQDVAPLRLWLAGRSKWQTKFRFTILQF